MVLQIALTTKVIPQFTSTASAKLEDNLFYSAIKAMPTFLSDATKKAITIKYTILINQKLVPQYKK